VILEAMKAEGFSGVKAKKHALRVDFNGSLRLEVPWFTITLDAGLARIS